MSTSRLLAALTLTAAAKLRVAHSTAGDIDITIPAGTYWHSADDSSSDLLKVIVDLLDAASGGITWTIQIYGVDGLSSSSIAEGRVRIVASAGTFTLEYSDTVNTTLPSGILGHTGTTDASSTGSVYVSDYVHQWGWYPQSFCQDPQPKDPELITEAGQSQDAQIFSAVTWGEVEVARVLWQLIPAELVREAAASNTERMALMLLEVDDPHCSYQRFILTAARYNAQIRLYPDTDDETTYHGPYNLPGTDKSPIRQNPLKLCTRASAPNWDVTFEGVRRAA